MSNEYIFFDQSLCHRFVQFATDHGLASTVRPDTMQGSVVELSEDLSEALEDSIEDEYETLMLEQMSLLEADDSESDRSVLGINVELASGQTCVVRLPPVLGRRLFEHFSTEEIHDLVNAVVHSVQSPSQGPLCKKA
jgi:DhnA family fructose-bisphosphate aldolase class Ia